MPAGRPPKPTTLKILEGNRGRRPLPENEIEPRKGEPECPVELSDVAKTEWARITKELVLMNLLAHTDRTALACYCQSLGRWLQAEAELSKSAMIYKTETGYPILNPWYQVACKERDMCHKFLTGFGFDPASRTRIIGTAAGAQGKEDPVEAFKKRKEQLKLINGKKEKPGKD